MPAALRTLTTKSSRPRVSSGRTGSPSSPSSGRWASKSSAGAGKTRAVSSTSTASATTRGATARRRRGPGTCRPSRWSTGRRRGSRSRPAWRSARACSIASRRPLRPAASRLRRPLATGARLRAPGLSQAVRRHRSAPRSLLAVLLGRRRPRSRRALRRAHRPAAGAVRRGVRAREPHRALTLVALEIFQRLFGPAPRRVLPLDTAISSAQPAPRRAAIQPASIVLALTPGPQATARTYFEQAFLAQYLALTLVRGEDLIVRETRVVPEDARRPEEGRRHPPAGERRLLRSARAPPRFVPRRRGPGRSGRARANVAIVQPASATGVLQTPARCSRSCPPSAAVFSTGPSRRSPRSRTYWCGDPAVARVTLTRATPRARHQAPTFPSGPTEPALRRARSPTNALDDLRDSGSAQRSFGASSPRRCVDALGRPVARGRRARPPRPCGCASTASARPRARAAGDYKDHAGRAVARRRLVREASRCRCDRAATCKDTWILAGGPVQALEPLAVADDARRALARRERSCRAAWPTISSGWAGTPSVRRGHGAPWRAPSRGASIGPRPRATPISCTDVLIFAPPHARVADVRTSPRQLATEHQRRASRTARPRAMARLRGRSSIRSRYLDDPPRNVVSDTRIAWRTLRDWISSRRVAGDRGSRSRTPAARCPRRRCPT